MREYKLSISLVLLTVFILFLTFACNDDCPNCPTCPELDNDYLFYIGAYVSGIDPIKVYSVNQQAYIDSFDLGIGFEEMAVIGHDEYIAVASNQGFRMMDLKTKEIVHENENWNKVRVSRDSRYMATFNQVEDRIEIYSFPGFDLVYFDTIQPPVYGWMGRFSNDSRYHTYLRQTAEPEPASLLVTYDIAGDSILYITSKHYNDYPLFIYDQWPVVSKNKVFLYCTLGANHYLCVSDLGTETVRILEQKSPFAVYDMIVSPDDKYLYFTAAPTTASAPYRNMVEVFDVESEQLIAEIPTSTETWTHEPDRMAISWDGRYLLSTTCWMGYPNALLMDARFFVSLTDIDFAYQTNPRIVACRQE